MATETIDIQVIIKRGGRPFEVLSRRLVVDEAVEFQVDLAGGGLALADVPGSQITTGSFYFLADDGGAWRAQLYSTSDNYIPMLAGGFILVCGAANATDPLPSASGTDADTTTLRGIVAGT